MVSHAHEMFAVLADPAIYEFENEAPVSEQALAQHCALMQSRQSPDGTEVWLNWVIRLSSGELAGYVQATVLPSGVALVAYELASRHWRQGIGSAAVAAMLAELRVHYAITSYVAVLKARNYRSVALLRKLGFKPANAAQAAAYGAEADELTMLKQAAGTADRHLPG